MMELVVSLLVLGGAALVFLGSLGLLTLKTFYERVHPPTMGTTLGTGLVIIGSMVFFTVHESRPVLHELLIAAFMTISTPVTYMLLVRAALYRDRSEGNDPLESKSGSEPEQETSG
jgi:multicomponent K+:H+ antiporter subunit G